MSRHGRYVNELDYRGSAQGRVTRTRSCTLAGRGQETPARLELTNPDIS